MANENPLRGYRRIHGELTKLGARIPRSAVQAPRMNATCERLAGTVRREIPGHMLIPGEAHLRAVTAEYQVHYNGARPRQGIAQHVPDAMHNTPPPAMTDLDIERIRRNQSSTA
jgi:transposase InsO family protein